MSRPADQPGLAQVPRQQAPVQARPTPNRVARVDLSDPTAILAELDAALVEQEMPVVKELPVAPVFKLKRKKKRLSVRARARKLHYHMPCRACGCRGCDHSCGDCPWP